MNVKNIIRQFIPYQQSFIVYVEEKQCSTTAMLTKLNPPISRL